MIVTASGLGARGHACTLFGRPGTAWSSAAAGAGVPVIDEIRGALIARGFGPRTKLHVLWKGVDASLFERAAARGAAVRAALGVALEGVAIGTVGRLAWQKGLDDLLAAARLVRARVPRARFFVIGGGR